MTEAVGGIAGQATVAGVNDSSAANPSGKSVQESIASQSALESALKAGLETIDQQQTIAFEKYLRLVLPADGFVFWVRANLVNEQALINSAAYNTWAPNQTAQVIAAPQDFVARGSLHITTINTQSPDESFSTNRVVFTSEQKVNDLNEIMPGSMYLANIHDFRFAFSQRSGFYKQANLFHYQGDAVYPVFEPQIIDTIEQLQANLQIVSNSLPIWLRLNRICRMFPSMLVPDNIRPPYGVIEILESDTSALQPIPWLDIDGSHWQLAKDHVRLIFYGLNNDAALDFQDYMIHESALRGRFGIMSPVIMRDVKRGQVELSAIAKKKSMELDVSYYQTEARAWSRQLIREAFVKDCYLEGIT